MADRVVFTDVGPRDGLQNQPKILTVEERLSLIHAVAAAFIFLNSLSGLGGHLYGGMSLSPQILLWILVVFAGGLAGFCRSRM